MKTFFFSLILFFVFIGGVHRLQATTTMSDFTIKPKDLSSEVKQTQRFKISAQVARLEDILVKEGDTVTVNQLLISRQTELNILDLQIAKAEEKLQFLQSRQIVAPIKPSFPPFPALPLANFEAQTLEIAAIKSRCDRLNTIYEEAKLQPLPLLSNSLQKLELIKQQKALELFQAQDYLNNLKSFKFDSHYITHQESKIHALQLDLQNLQADIEAEKLQYLEKVSFHQEKKNADIQNKEYAYLQCKENLQIAEAKLNKAKYDRQIAEQNHVRLLSIYEQEKAKAEQIYQRDMIEYNRIVESQKLAIFEAEKLLSELKLKRLQVTQVITPYAGKISQIKILGASNGYVNVEFSVVF